MTRRKPQQNYSVRDVTTDLRDSFQTPAYALDPLAPYLHAAGVQTVWESACGMGYLVAALRQAGYDVTATDILTGHDYYAMEPPRHDCQVTNVPFSHKYRWLARACELGKPFALLMPSDMLFAAAGQRLLIAHDLRLLVPDKRIDFRTPTRGWAGSSAQMHTSWVTHGLGLPERLTFCALQKPRPATKAAWDAVEAGQQALFASPPRVQQEAA